VGGAAPCGGNCPSGFKCEDNQCVLDTARCSDDGNEVLDRTGALIEDCGLYRCANTGCLKACASTADCASGSACDVEEGRCVLDDGRRADSGCGCRVAEPRRPTAWGLLLFGLLAGRRYAEGRKRHQKHSGFLS
jgi:MYXO-CTERM domain-containing protein